MNSFSNISDEVETLQALQVKIAAGNTRAFIDARASCQYIGVLCKVYGKYLLDEKKKILEGNKKKSEAKLKESKKKLSIIDKLQGSVKAKKVALKDERDGLEKAQQYDSSDSDTSDDEEIPEHPVLKRQVGTHK